MPEFPNKNARRVSNTAAGGRAARVDAYDLEAEAIKALAHPKRLLVLDLLSDGREMSVGDMMDAIGISQSNLSQNLAIMRTTGLLTARRDGNVVYYSVTDRRVVKAVALVRAALEEHVESRRTLMERAATQKKERLRRGGAYAAVGILGLAAVLALAAGLHPLAVGGGLADVGAHTALLATSMDASTLWDVCANVRTAAPSASATTMPM